MKWTDRSGNTSKNTAPPVNSTAHAQTTQRPIGKSKETKRKLFSFHIIMSTALLFATTLLILAVICFIMNYRQKDESLYIQNDKYQSIVLSNGQMYYGKIHELDSDYIAVADIYYLHAKQQAQSMQGEQSDQDIALVKLGCELYGPQDQMIISREQIVFWGNLRPDSKVVKAIESYRQANPNDQQKCEANSQQPTT